MYKLCKTEQSARRQRELEEGLLALMKQRRYEEITISDLCELMEIPRKSFYRYFSSKDGALHALLDHTLLDVQQTGAFEQNGNWDSAVAAMERYFLFWLGRRPLLDALIKNGLSDILVQRAINQALAERLVPSGAVPDALRSVRAQAITFGVSGLMCMVLAWQREGYVRTPREMACVAALIMSTPLMQISEGKK